MTDEPQKQRKYVVEQTQDIATNLDPQLQKAIVEARSAGTVDPALGTVSSDGRVLLDVLARLRDPSVPVVGLNVVRTIGDVVTGTVDLEHIEAIRADKNVVSLKGARRVRPALKVSVPEVQGSQSVLREHLPKSPVDINGAGVIVGIVDYGCDFVHRNFRNADGTTRLLFLWDQGTGVKTANSPDGFPYGREFDHVAINEVLESDDPYMQLAYNPGDEAHGTHVMDIAAGNGGATGITGVAPQADLVFVHLSQAKTPSQENIGNFCSLVEAVEYIFKKAEALNRSAVVNLSIGTNGGPHDGSSLIDRTVDHLLQTPGRAVVIAAGNSWNEQIHASGRILPGQRRVLKWQLWDSDPTENEVEIWYNGNAQLSVTLLDPSGEPLAAFPIGTTSEIKVEGEKVGLVIHRQKDPNNGDNQIDIVLEGGAFTGEWSIVLSPVGNQLVDFHAWIERDNSRPSQFSTEDNDSSCTLNTIACAESAIVVGSYDARVDERTISSFSSEGPTRDGRQKPDISAPGHEIIAARSLSQESFQTRGTSMAAPHVTGLIALLMQVAPSPLTAATIRNAIINVARKDPPTGSDWQPRYGAGRISAVATIRSILGLAPLVLPIILAASVQPPEDNSSSGSWV